MAINVRVFHAPEPLFGRTNPPKGSEGPRRATMARGDASMRSIKRYEADGKRIIVRALKMGKFYHVTLSERLRDDVLYSGLARDGEPFRARRETFHGGAEEEWWVVLSSKPISADSALPGYCLDGRTMVCAHDERYMEERDADRDGAYARWAASEQAAHEAAMPPIETALPLPKLNRPPQSWPYCSSVLSPLLAKMLDKGNGAIPSATTLAALQALAACSSGETRRLIERLVGNRWSSATTPFDILGLAPNGYCSPRYRASIATSTWVADRFEPDHTCVEELSSLDVEKQNLGPDLRAASERISNWIHRETQGYCKPGIDLDPLTQFVVVSAMFFKDAWSKPFSASCNEEGAFLGNDGLRTIKYMRGLRTGSVSRLKRCRAASLGMTTGASLVVVLPDRDVALADVLASGEAIEAAASHTVSDARGWDSRVDWWMPKFDVTGVLSGTSEKLIPGFGISPWPDFSPVTGDEESITPRCDSEARVKIDEDGIEASGYTMISMAAAGLPKPDTRPIVPFIVDRPFAFVLVSKTKEPMFIGAVMRPEGY